MTIAVSRATKEETRFPLTLHNVRVRQITWERVSSRRMHCVSLLHRKEDTLTRVYRSYLTWEITVRYDLVASANRRIAQTAGLCKTAV